MVPKGWIYAAVFMLMAGVWVLNFNQVQDNDTWWHLAMGKWMVEERDRWAPVIKHVGLSAN